MIAQTIRIYQSSLRKDIAFETEGRILPSFRIILPLYSLPIQEDISLIRYSLQNHLIFQDMS